MEEEASKEGARAMASRDPALAGFRRWAMTIRVDLAAYSSGQRHAAEEPRGQLPTVARNRGYGGCAQKA
jgi:hypothetical protein